MKLYILKYENLYTKITRSQYCIERGMVVRLMLSVHMDVIELLEIFTML